MGGGSEGGKRERRVGRGEGEGGEKGRVGVGEARRLGR